MTGLQGTGGGGISAAPIKTQQTPEKGSEMTQPQAEMNKAIVRRSVPRVQDR